MAFIAAQAPRMTDEDVAELATVLAAGPVLRHGGADIASTGGPSSLSTLLCPLYLRLLGAVVPKLGVPGRPAGGIDVLAGLAGFDANLDPENADRVLSETGYVHLLAGQNWAPIDAAFFRWRRDHDRRVSDSALATASLLAKKLAMGAERAGLDVRVAAHGNFGDWDAAHASGRVFARVATLLGIRPSVFLTDASIPYQPWLGRGESLLALDACFSEGAGKWLGAHAADCWVMACRASGIAGETPPRPSGADLRCVFEDNLIAQGSSVAAFATRVARLRAESRSEVRATGAGFATADLAGLRELLVAEQSKHRGVFPDPAGVELLVLPGSAVRPGDLLARVRGPEAFAAAMAALLAPAREPRRRRTLKILEL